jgi:hypothetical protein
MFTLSSILNFWRLTSEFFLLLLFSKEDRTWLLGLLGLASIEPKLYSYISSNFFFSLFSLICFAYENTSFTLNKYYD